MFEYELPYPGVPVAKYDIENRLGVASHLSSHPFLAAVLDEAADEIRARFGNAQLFLSPMPVRGSDSEPCLLVKIKPPVGMSRENALGRLDAFDDEWWLEQPTDIDQKLVITLG